MSNNNIAVDQAPHQILKWYDINEVKPTDTMPFYVVQCNNGFITVCNWYQPKSRWFDFYFCGTAKPVSGVVRWMEIDEPYDYDDNGRMVL